MTQSTGNEFLGNVLLYKLERTLIFGIQPSQMRPSTTPTVLLQCTKRIYLRLIFLKNVFILPGNAVWLPITMSGSHSPAGGAVPKLSGGAKL